MFFRVKELGAEEGSNTPMEDEELMLANIDEDYDILQTKNVWFFILPYSAFQ